MSKNISLKEFINNKYSQYLDTITTLSNTGKKEFITDDRKLYNFDKMISEFYNDTYKPKSADALYILDDNTILFVEFKTGYQHNVSICNFADNKYCSICCYKNIYPICHEKYCYLTICKKLAHMDKQKGIFLKIVESYIIFKEKFIPKYLSEYNISSGNYKFIFWLVIEAPVDGIINSYKKKKNTKQRGNIFSDIEHSFQRFYDKENKSYYDKIVVLSEFEFKNKVNNLFL